MRQAFGENIPYQDNQNGYDKRSNDLANDRQNFRDEPANLISHFAARILPKYSYPFIRAALHLSRAFDKSEDAVQNEYEYQQDKSRGK